MREQHWCRFDCKPTINFLISILPVRRVLQITKRAGVPLIINDRVDVAMAIGAGTALLPSRCFHTDCSICAISLSYTSATLTYRTYTMHLSDGVHVGQSDMSAAEVRRLLGPNMILGVSTKSCAEVRRGDHHLKGCFLRLLCLS